MRTTSFFQRLLRRPAPHTNRDIEPGQGIEDSRNASSNAETEELFSTVGEYGLQTLSENANDIVEYVVGYGSWTSLTSKTSIVFVHGLTGNRESTWTDKPTKVFWPKDLLAEDLSRARIITFGYDADIVRGLSVAGNGTLRDHGKALAEDLAMRRKKTGTVRLFKTLFTIDLLEPLDHENQTPYQYQSMSSRHKVVA
jgi:hypothetical protein